MRRNFLRNKTMLVLGLAVVTIAGLSLAFTKINQKSVAAKSNYIEDDAVGTKTVSLKGSQNTSDWRWRFTLDGEKAWCAQDKLNVPDAAKGDGSNVRVNVYRVTDSSKDKLKSLYKIMYYGDQSINGGEDKVIDRSIHLSVDAVYNDSVYKAGTEEWAIYDLYNNEPLPLGENYVYEYVDTTGKQNILAYSHEDVKYKQVSVEKVWDEGEVGSIYRPSNIKVSLLNGETVIDTVILDKEHNWRHEWKNLSYDGNYSVREEGVVSNYSSDKPVCTTNGDTTSCTINNHIDLTELLVRKEWIDDNDAAKKRPGSIEVELVKDGVNTGETLTLSANNDWSGVFKNLEKDHVYSTIELTELEDYYLDSSKSGCDNDGCVLTNHITGKKTINVTKIWDDHGDKEGKRPAFVSFKVEKYSNTGVLLGDFIVTTSISDDEYKNTINAWEMSFGPYDQYDENGAEFAYEVKEYALYDADGNDITTLYELVSATGNEDDGFKFVNEREELTQLYLIKTWIDNYNSENKRQSVDFNIYANGVYYSTVTLTEDDKYDPCNSIAGCNEFEVANNGYYLMNRWVKAVNNLPKYDEYDNEIIWTAKETTVVDGYINGATICNIKSKECEATNRLSDTLKIRILKEWSDADNYENVRPGSVLIQILGSEYNYSGNAQRLNLIDTMTVSAPSWTADYSEELPMYDYRGRKISYVAREITSGPYTGVLSSTSEISNNNVITFTFTNTRTTETSIELIKCWVDGENESSYRPESLSYILRDTYDGVSTDTGIRLTASDLNEYTGCWERTITNLPLYEDGDTDKAHVYTIIENNDQLADTDYELDFENSSVDENGECDAMGNDWICQFTNRLVGKTEVKGIKTWLDDTNKNGTRPENLDIVIYRSSKTERKHAINVEPTWSNKNSNNWNYIFANLDKYDNAGYAYTYTVEEKNKTINAADNSGDVYVSQATASANNFVNLLTGKVNFCGKKVWRSEEAPEEFAPSDISVTLTRSNDASFSKTITVNALSSVDAIDECESRFNDDIEIGKDGVTDIWYFYFSDEDKYNDSGVEYKYEFNEDAVETYITSYNDVHDTIFNDYDVRDVKIRLVKQWIDDKEEDRQPVFFTIIRIYNGIREDYKTVELNAENDWTYEEYFDGNFEWDVREETELSGYTKGQAVRTVLEDGTIQFTIPNTIDHSLAVYFVTIPGILAAGFVAGRRFLMSR